jgi:hypothetical protein
MSNVNRARVLELQRDTYQKTVNSGQRKQALRIGWEVPCHLFEGKTGESLCSQSGIRETIPADETQETTSPIEYPLKHLRNKNEVTGFANGICGRCLQAYYTRYGNTDPILHLDTYSESIANSGSNDRLGFCRACGSPVDPGHCSGTLFNGEYPAYICDECNLRNFVGIVEGVEHDSGPGTSTSTLLTTLRDTLSELEDQDRSSYSQTGVHQRTIE